MKKITSVTFDLVKDDESGKVFYVKAKEHADIMNCVLEAKKLLELNPDYIVVQFLYQNEYRNGPTAYTVTRSTTSKTFKAELEAEKEQFNIECSAEEENQKNHPAKIKYFELNEKIDSMMNQLGKDWEKIGILSEEMRACWNEYCRDMHAGIAPRMEEYFSKKEAENRKMIEEMQKKLGLEPSVLGEN